MMKLMCVCYLKQSFYSQDMTYFFCRFSKHSTTIFSRSRAMRSAIFSSLSFIIYVAI